MRGAAQFSRAGAERGKLRAHMDYGSGEVGPWAQAGSGSVPHLCARPRRDQSGGRKNCLSTLTRRRAFHIHCTCTTGLPSQQPGGQIHPFSGATVDNLS